MHRAFFHEGFMRRYLLPGIAGLMLCAMLTGLGIWQLQRLDWKQAMLAEIRAGIAAAPAALPAAPEPAMKYLPVRLAGRTTGDEILVLSGTRERGGGYRVISGFETDDGRRVMLDRGFIPQDDRHRVRPPVTLEITGNLHWPDEKGSATPAPNLTEKIWFAREVPAMAAHLRTEPVLVVASQVSGDAQGVVPIAISISGIPNNHLGYAVTW